MTEEVLSWRYESIPEWAKLYLDQAGFSSTFTREEIKDRGLVGAFNSMVALMKLVEDGDIEAIIENGVPKVSITPKGIKKAEAIKND